MIRFFSKWRKISLQFEELINPRPKITRKFENSKIEGYSSDAKSSHGCIAPQSQEKDNTDNNKLKPRKLEEVSDLNCKTGVVIGGDGGIGYAAAHEILSHNARRVGIFGKNVCKGLEACHMLNCRFGKKKAVFYKVDVTHKTDIECAICKLNDEYGKIEVFVNAFGICDGKNWQNELNTNLIGMTRCTISEYKYLSECSTGGVIVNTSGIFGMKPSAGCPTTSAAQHGIIGLSRSFGSEKLFKHSNVRVITVCPGITETKLLKGACKRALTEIMGNCLQEEIDSMKKQKPEACGSAIVWLIRYARSGSLWLIDGAELYKINCDILKNCTEWYNQFTV